MTAPSPLLPIESLVLRDEAARSRAVVAPSRGGILTRLEVAGRSVLYLDPETLADTTKNVRGGNPVLFPSPGPLAGDRFAWRGKTGAMKQHGLARQLPWTVVASSEREATLELLSDDETRAAYPWDFALRIRYALEGAGLAIETTVTNRSPDAMPFALGFHPYFAVSDGDKARARVPTTATRAWDNVAKKEISSAASFGPELALTQKEVDLHLHDHAGRRALLELGDGARVVVAADEAFGRWVVWTVAGRDFVCVEPWTAAADALNRDASLIVLGPGESSRALRVAITLET